MKAFHAYDVRGIYNADFNKDDVYKIGFFLSKLLKTNKVLVGSDVRESSPEIYEYLTKGITDSGSDVYNIGAATTPMVYFATAKFNFDASVQITASHNPKEYNGLKISRTNALPVGYDSGLAELEAMMKSETISVSENKGKIIDFEVRSQYIEFQKQYVSDISNLKIAMDCSNGMAALLVKDLYGNQPIYIYDELDGTFPNHEANPLIAKNIVDLQKLTLDNKCDIGVIFDGDADRVMFVDENAEFISPDLMIAVLGNHFLANNKKAKVLQDIRTSNAVGEYLRPMGAEMHTWRVGRAYAALKLRELDGLFGGELAGHYYFKDFYYSDSGLLACSLILKIVSDLKTKGIKLSQLISQIRTYENSGEINFKIEKKAEAMDVIRAHFTATQTPAASYDFDGYRVEFPDWWFNIRPSNTEPYLRFIAEAKSKTLLDSKVAQVKEILSKF